MSKDEAPALKRNETGKARSPADAGSLRHQLLRSRDTQTKAGNSSRPKTVLVMTGAGQAMETGLHCVSMLANAGHRVVTVVADGSAPEEFTKGPVADRIACIREEGGTETMLRNALGNLPERFRHIDALISMVCIEAPRRRLLEKDAPPFEADSMAGTRQLVNAVRAVLPSLSASAHGHAIAVMVPEHGLRHGKLIPSLHHEHAELLIAALRAELAELGVRFTRIQSGPLQRHDQLTPGDVIQAVAWALGQPHHLAVCDIAIQPAPLARPALTRREQEVLAWTACGKTSDEISRILDLSVSGVNFHLTNCVSKLDSCNKMAAVACATRLGILS